MALSNEFLLGSLGSILVIIVSAVSWFVRLEAKGDNNAKKLDGVELMLSARILESAKAINERIMEVSLQSSSRFTENSRAIEKVDVRVDRTDAKQESTANEVRQMLLQITRSLSQIEGKLSINSKNEDR